MTSHDPIISFSESKEQSRGHDNIKNQESMFNSPMTPLLPKLRSERNDSNGTESDGERIISNGAPFKRPSIAYSSSGLSAAPRMGALGICFVAFFNVSGGPWGSEGIVASLGPLPGFIGIFVISALWGLPLALVTAELSSVYPDDGGYSIWVAEAFGEFWGFQESYWSWVSGVIDNAIYPVLAFKTMEKLIFYNSEDGDASFGFLSAFALKIVLTFGFSAPLFFTVKEFGAGLGIVALFVSLPFLVFAIHSFFLAEGRDYSLLFYTNKFESRSDFLGGLQDLAAILYWNFSGLDCVSTCAGEVRNPERSYKKGLLLAIMLIVASYVITLSAAVVSADAFDWISWDEGSFVPIVESNMGMAMGLWIVVASFVGNAGMHAAEMFEDSWQLCGMAEAGLAPRIFAARSANFNTPYMAILFSMLIISLLITLEFKQIVVVNNFFSITSAMLELVAFLSLRFNEQPGDPDRSFTVLNTYRLPIQSRAGLIAFLAVPFTLATFVMLSSFFDSVFSVVLDSLALLCGVLLYKLMKRRGAIKYERRKSLS